MKEIIVLIFAISILISLTAGLQTVRKQYLSEEEQEKFNFVEKQKQSGKKLVYIHQKKGKTHFVEEYFKRKQDWIILGRTHKTFKYECDLIWDTDDDQFDYHRQLSSSLYNFPYNWDTIGEKMQLRRNLKNFDEKGQFTINSTSFYPRSFMLRFYKPQLTKDETYFLTKINEGSWIQKPVHTKRSPIIHTSVPSLKEYIKSKKPSVRLPWPKKHTYYLEKYITDVHSYGDRKYSLRTFLLVPWNYPRIALYRDGYIVLNPSKLDMNTLDLKTKEGKWTHLVKLEYYKKETETQSIKEKILLMDEYKQVLKSEDRSDQEIEQMFQKIKEAMAYSFLSVKDEFKNADDAFVLYQCDFLINKDLNPWLLGIQAYPTMLDITQTLGNEFQQITNELLDFVLFMKNNKSTASDLLKNPKSLPLGKMEILYNGVTNYSIIDKYLAPKSEKKEDL